MEREAPEVGVSLRDQAEQVVDLALEAAGGERARRERGKGRCGPRDLDEYGQRRRQSRRGEYVGERESAAGGASGRRGEGLAPDAERRPTIRPPGEVPSRRPTLDRARRP